MGNSETVCNGHPDNLKFLKSRSMFLSNGKNETSYKPYKTHPTVFDIFSSCVTSKNCETVQMKRFILVLKLSVLVCAGKLLLIHPCGISVCYLKSRQAFARGLTGEEEEEENNEDRRGGGGSLRERRLHRFWLRVNFFVDWWLPMHIVSWVVVWDMVGEWQSCERGSAMWLAVVRVWCAGPWDSINAPSEENGTWLGKYVWINQFETNVGEDAFYSYSVNFRFLF